MPRCLSNVAHFYSHWQQNDIVGFHLKFAATLSNQWGPLLNSADSCRSGFLRPADPIVLLSATCFTVLALSSGCSESTTDKRVSSSNVHFTDVTAAAGLALRSPTFAVAAGDIDADGLPAAMYSNTLKGKLFPHLRGETRICAICR